MITYKELIELKPGSEIFCVTEEGFIHKAVCKDIVVCEYDATAIFYKDDNKTSFVLSLFKNARTYDNPYYIKLSDATDFGYKLALTNRDRMTTVLRNVIDQHYRISEEFKNERLMKIWNLLDGD